MSKRKLPTVSHLLAPFKIRKLCDNEIDLVVNSDEKSSDGNFFLDIKTKLTRTIELCEQNKLTKENVWDMNAIDLLHMLTESNDKPDYRFMGLCIEGVTKIYVLRLDSLYDATIRMSSFLGRLATTDRPTKNKSNIVKPETEGTREARRGPTRRRIKRKQTVTRNPESLNAKLLTRPIIDPFFGKLNTFVGEIMRPKRMLMNLLPPSHIKGNTGLSLNAPFWDSSDQTESVVFQDLVTVSLNINIQDAVLGPSSFADYRITDDAYEYFKPETFVNLSSDDDNDDKTTFFDDIEMASDANPTIDYTWLDSGIETLRTTQFSYLPTNMLKLPVSYKGQVECSMESSAINGQEFIEDMEPTSTHKFEYTYRANDLIKNYYVGPSYWKFFSQKQPKSDQKRTNVKKQKFSKSVTIEDLRGFDETENFLLKCCVCGPFTLQKKPRNKFILPFNYDVSLEIFQGFLNSSLSLDDPICDGPSCPLDHKSTQSVAESDNGFADCDLFDNNISEYLLKGNSYSRQFDHRPRSFDIKKIKDLSLLIIENEAENGKTEVQFSSVCFKVNKMFENSSSESSSCACTLLSLLQAACEKKVTLKQDKPLDDFLISRRI